MTVKNVPRQIFATLYERGVLSNPFWCDLTMTYVKGGSCPSKETIVTAPRRATKKKPKTREKCSECGGAWGAMDDILDGEHPIHIGHSRLHLFSSADSE